MQIILPDEEIHQIQLLISQLIKNEIENKLNHNSIESPFLNKQQAIAQCVLYNGLHAICYLD